MSEDNTALFDTIEQYLKDPSSFPPRKGSEDDASALLGFLIVSAIGLSAWVWLVFWMLQNTAAMVLQMNRLS
jgi:hypothetical protein